MDTVCTEHTRLHQATSTESVSSVESTHINLESIQRIKKRNRSRRVNTTRQYHNNPKMWKKIKENMLGLQANSMLTKVEKSFHKKMIKPCVCRHGRQCIFRCATFSDDMRKTIYYRSTMPLLTSAGNELLCSIIYFVCDCTMSQAQAQISQVLAAIRWCESQSV